MRLSIFLRNGNEKGHRLSRSHVSGIVIVAQKGSKEGDYGSFFCFKGAYVKSIPIRTFEASLIHRDPDGCKVLSPVNCGAADQQAVGQGGAAMILETGKFGISNDITFCVQETGIILDEIAACGIKKIAQVAIGANVAGNDRVD